MKLVMNKKRTTFEKYFYKHNPTEKELNDYTKTQVNKISKSFSNHTCFLLASHLKSERLWTGSAINRFLPPPKEETIGAKLQQGWSRERIFQVEAQEDFRNWMKERLRKKYKSDAKNGLKHFISNFEAPPYNINFDKVVELDSDFIDDLEFIELECQFALALYPILERAEFDRKGYPLHIMREVKALQNAVDATPQTTAPRIIPLLGSKKPLRPTVSNPNKWYPERPSTGIWRKIRKEVLERDNNKCFYCGHISNNYMNVHHVGDSSDNDISNLMTCCVACHAVLHLGRNLSLEKVEVWSTSMSQVDIIKYTRANIKEGLSLQEIKESLPIKEGKYPPSSLKYANDLINQIGDRTTAELEEPLSVVFVDFVRWQIDDNE